MPWLHTVNKSPFERDSLASCVRLARPGSAILLLEDGVYAAIAASEGARLVAASVDRFDWFVLAPDLAARGIEPERVHSRVTAVDHAGFVDLVVQYDGVNAWL